MPIEITWFRSCKVLATITAGDNRLSICRMVAVSSPRPVPLSDGRNIVAMARVLWRCAAVDFLTAMATGRYITSLTDYTTPVGANFPSTITSKALNVQHFRPLSLAGVAPGFTPLWLLLEREGTLA